MAVKLEHLKSISGTIHCADDDYLYTTSSLTVFKTDSQGIKTEGYTFPSGSISVIVAMGGGILLAVIKDAESKSSIYKSADNGATFGASPVLLLGDTDGTVANQIINVNTLLDRGICNATVNGTSVYLIGEYNTLSTGDTTWDATDQLRLMRSDDLGDTWTVAAEWNTSAVQTRHIHCVRQHDYTGDIYIGFGDIDSHCGIVRWDGTTTLPRDTAVTDYGSDFDTNGYSGVGGAQRYRVCDFLFFPDYMVFAADTSSSDVERGMWILSNDLSSMQRVDSKIKEYDDHAGYVGLKTSTGNCYFTELISGDVTDPQMNIWGSSDAGYHWDLIGKYTCVSGDETRGANAFFEWNNIIYCLIHGIADNLSGNYYTELVEYGAFTDDIPTILYPVYYVTPTGSNSNNGMDIDAGWASIEYAMEGNSVTYGTRIKISEGSYTETKINPVWDTVTRPGTGDVVIEGAGKDKTQITIGATDYAFYVTEDEKFILKDLSIIPTSEITISYLFNLQANSYVETLNCSIGDETNDVNTVVRLLAGSTFKALRGDINQKNATGHFMFLPGAAGAFVEIDFSVVSGGAYQFNIASALNLKLRQSICTGYGTKSVYINALETTLDVKNNIFDGLPTATASVQDTKVCGFDDDDIDGNCYVDGVDYVLNVGNRGGSHSIDIDPKLNSLNKLQSTSLCVGSGVNIPDLHGVRDYFLKYGYGQNNIGIDLKTGMPSTGSQRIFHIGNGMFGR